MFFINFLFSLMNVAILIIKTFTVDGIPGWDMHYENKNILDKRKIN